MNFYRWLKNKYILGALLLAAAAMPFAYAIDSRRSAGESVHAAITREALKEILSNNNLNAVIVAEESQDVPGSEAAAEKRLHFGGPALAAAAAYMLREQNRAVNLACEADTDKESRADALRHFGLMLHSAQDFYLHTNYLELCLEQPQYRADVYNLPLVDWGQVPGGYAGASTGAKLCGYDCANAADVLNKDSATATGGALPIAKTGASQFAVARDLALRETQRQWHLFTVLVKQRCGQRAAAVLSALQQGDLSEPENK